MDQCDSLEYNREKKNSQIKSQALSFRFKMNTYLSKNLKDAQIPKNDVDKLPEIDHSQEIIAKKFKRNLKKMS